MSDQPLSPNDGSTQWQEATSKNGKAYRVDKQEPIGTEKGKDKPALMEKKPFSIDVYWPVTKDWVDTTEEVKKVAAITRYKLIRHPPPPPPPPEKPPPYSPEYTLWFTNTEHYHYYFTDETNDTYDNNTFVNHDHWIQYDSQKPTIVKITGV
ncbi:hypothetical protein JMJ35_001769 [Cladonia borealis]|uniref:Uncharacterized protein n=1 Tax=Cladonia borealis TaxID=184061 RepID=A0AA39R8I9_9LECA|nr:hypothetical protein JMJ35_001769 [Cladonia borealis]